MSFFSATRCECITNPGDSDSSDHCPKGGSATNLFHQLKSHHCKIKTILNSTCKCLLTHQRKLQINQLWYELPAISKTNREKRHDSMLLFIEHETTVSVLFWILVVVWLHQAEWPHGFLFVFRHILWNYITVLLIVLSFSLCLVVVEMVYMNFRWNSEVSSLLPLILGALGLKTYHV